MIRIVSFLSQLPGAGDILTYFISDIEFYKIDKIKFVVS